MNDHYQKLARGLLVATIMCLQGCMLFSGSKEIPISEMAKSRLHEANGRFGIPITLAHQSEGQAITFFAAFDGTMNDRLSVPPGEDATVVAKLYDAVHAPEALAEDATASRLAKHYEKGPGCAIGALCWVDAATGYSSEATANSMLSALKRFASGRKRGTELHVVAIGFSRGAATARHFLNLVYESAKSGYLRDVGLDTWSYALLLDTVATGQESHLNLSLPPNVELLLHYVAANEARPLFAPIVDVDTDFEQMAVTRGIVPPQRVWTIVVPGAHSDVGDSYLSGAGALISANAEATLMTMGLIEPRFIELCPQSDQGTSSERCRSLDEGLHDSRGILDRVFSVGSPFACGFRRPISMFAVSRLSGDAAASLVERLRMQRANVPAVGRPTGIGSRTTNMYVFDATSGSATWPVLAPRLGGYAGHDALVDWQAEQVVLTLTDPINNAKRISIPKPVLQELWNRGGRAKIELNVGKADGPWWFVDECLPSVD